MLLQCGCLQHNVMVETTYALKLTEHYYVFLNSTENIMYNAKYFHLLTLVLFLWLSSGEHRISIYIYCKMFLDAFVHITQLFNMHYIQSRSTFLVHFKMQISFAYLEYIQICTAFSHQWKLLLT